MDCHGRRSFHRALSLISVALAGRSSTKAGSTLALPLFSESKKCRPQMNDYKQTNKFLIGPGSFQRHQLDISRLFLKYCTLKFRRHQQLTSDLKSPQILSWFVLWPFRLPQAGRIKREDICAPNR